MKLVFGVDNIKLVDQDGAPCGRKVSLESQRVVSVLNALKLGIYYMESPIDQSR